MAEERNPHSRKQMYVFRAGKSMSINGKMPSNTCKEFKGENGERKVHPQY